MRCYGRTPRGLSATQIAVPYEYSPDPVFSEKIQIDEVAGDVLSDSFEAAYHITINVGKLLDDIGFLGATPALKKILEGTYIVLLDMEKHTRLLFEETARIFAKTVEDIIATFVTTKDFHDWLLTADENIQSSKLGAHFRHY